MNLELYWFAPDDIVALSNLGTGASVMPPLIPPGIQTMDEDGLRSSQGLLIKFRDESGRAIGFGTELEGTLYIHEVKRKARSSNIS